MPTMGSTTWLARKVSRVLWLSFGSQANQVRFETFECALDACTNVTAVISCVPCGHSWPRMDWSWPRVTRRTVRCVVAHGADAYAHAPDDLVRRLVLIRVVHFATQARPKQRLENQPVDNVADLERDAAIQMELRRARAESLDGRRL